MAAGVASKQGGEIGGTRALYIETFPFGLVGTLADICGYENDRRDEVEEDGMALRSALSN